MAIFFNGGYSFINTHRNEKENCGLLSEWFDESSLIRTETCQISFQCFITRNLLTRSLFLSTQTHRSARASVYINHKYVWVCEYIGDWCDTQAYTHIYISSVLIYGDIPIPDPAYSFYLLWCLSRVLQPSFGLLMRIDNILYTSLILINNTILNWIRVDKWHSLLCFHTICVIYQMV